MNKITYDEYLKLLRDPDTDDEVLLSYSVIERGEGGFDFVVRADPAKVDMSTADKAFENAMQIGNGFARFRRQAKFQTRKQAGTKLPVLVSEGDSWFQFPLLVREIIDQLYDDYLVWSVGAAGDTAENMVLSSLARGKTEYLKALLDNQESVRAFLFSAAGNDIIGQDPETNRPVLLDLLKDFNGNVSDVDGHINQPLLDEKFDFLRTAYATVISTIRAEPGFEDLPIIIHGYDYTFPYPWGASDPRNPKHADRNEWLGKPLDARGIQDQTLRRNIIKRLIDSLYELLANIAGDPQVTGIWLVDCRGAMPDVSDWIDEIHGTTAGFEKIAARFKPVIAQAIR